MIVSKVRKDSLAEAAGIRGGNTPVQYGRNTIYLGGDIITAIDGLPVQTLADYYSALEDKVPGDTVKVKIYRNKKYLELEVKLESEVQSSSI